MIYLHFKRRFLQFARMKCCVKRANLLSDRLCLSVGRSVAFDFRQPGIFRVLPKNDRLNCDWKLEIPSVSGKDMMLVWLKQCTLFDSMT